MKTSRRPITLILQKCAGQTGPDKHNSKYDMMCSVNLCKVLYDSTESRIKKRKKREKEKRLEGLRKPRCKADWCPNPKIGVLKKVLILILNKIELEIVLVILLQHSKNGICI